MQYDVIVVGGGHAGVEAAFAASRMKQKTLLVTLNQKMIGSTPCNPSIGGPAKGIVVREIDALGGIMGQNSDDTMIQMKELNSSKGPAVRAYRAQIDKTEYPKKIQEKIAKISNLKILEDMVIDIIVKNNQVKGIKLEKNNIINAKSVIITTGTYMDSLIVKGHNTKSEGPDNERTSQFLSENLKNLGIKLFRLKTGTPPRVNKNTIDYSKTKLENGSLNQKISFSYTKPQYLKDEDQVPCYLTYTNTKTHEIIKNNLDKSPIFSGVIEGVGPRYCPSIEDKVNRFYDKERHQIFLEPETHDGLEIYVQGLSTSMPEDIQLKMLKTIAGLENVEVIRYGYAIEYDAIMPEQLKNTLELKTINNLFFAGQIIGTSGYEEAAGLGIVAGTNAALKNLKEKPFILTREDSYIGLMIDDLITKDNQEPYRLLTSRSEYRLILRSDNADQRLTKKGYEVGLVSDEQYETFKDKLLAIDDLKAFIEKVKLGPKDLSVSHLEILKIKQINQSFTLKELLKRPEITFNKLCQIIEIPFPEDVMQAVEINTKYEGYIKKLKSEIKKIEKYDHIKIPKDINYEKVFNLAIEAREKLIKIQPENLGQASRIAGVTPSDTAMLEIHLKQKRKI